MAIESAFADFATGIMTMSMTSTQVEIVQKGAKVVDKAIETLESVQLDPEDLKSLKKTQFQAAAIIPVAAAMPRGTTLFGSLGSL